MEHALPKHLVSFFWYFIKKQPIAFTFFFIAPISLVLETSVMPYALKMVIDGVLGHTGDKSTIFSDVAPGFWLYGAAWVSLVTIIRIQHEWQSYVIPKFQASIRLEVLKYLTGHSYQYFSDHMAGNLANKVHDLPGTLENIRMTLCWNIITVSAITVTALVMMATINPLFSIILGTWVVFHVAGTVFLAQKVNRASETNAEDRSVLSGTVVDTLSNIIPVKLFSRKGHAVQYVAAAQNKENISNKHAIKAMNRLHLWMDVAVALMLGAMLYAIVFSWKEGWITTGDMTFIMLSAVGVMNHMWFMGQGLTNLFRDVGVAKQALSLINQPHQIVDIPDAKPLQVSQGRIVFDRVTFYYQRNNHLFRNQQVVIEPGTKVGLVGFSGSGKTTFVNLILRFFDVGGGRILIDGQDIAKVTQSSLRECIAMIPQDTSLFHRSLMENIRYGRLDATDEEVIEASKKAHCHEFITQLPEGYSALVGERGIKLSGGQRQRIAIARAMLKDAPILILDEATSALDSVTEKHIQEGLHHLMQNRTTIVIAHRLSTLSEMDRILVFDKGHIIEDGVHGTLLKKGGHYARMWHMQAGGFLPEQEG